MLHGGNPAGQFQRHRLAVPAPHCAISTTLVDQWIRPALIVTAVARLKSVGRLAGWHEWDLLTGT